MHIIIFVFIVASGIFGIKHEAMAEISKFVAKELGLNCKVKNCIDPYWGKGYCHHHYEQKRWTPEIGQLC